MENEGKECDKCEGGGDFCGHEQRICHDECPEGHIDCEGCSFAIKCEHCNGTGWIDEINTVHWEALCPKCRLSFYVANDHEGDIICPECNFGTKEPNLIMERQKKNTCQLSNNGK